MELALGKDELELGVEGWAGVVGDVSFFSALAVILSSSCWMSISPLVIASYVWALGAVDSAVPATGGCSTVLGTTAEPLEKFVALVSAAAGREGEGLVWMVLSLLGTSFSDTVGSWEVDGGRSVTVTVIGKESASCSIFACDIS